MSVTRAAGEGPTGPLHRIREIDAHVRGTELAHMVDDRGTYGRAALNRVVWPTAQADMKPP